MCWRGYVLNELGISIGGIENYAQSVGVVRRFLIEEMRVPPTQVDAIDFNNAHRLPRRISAVKSEKASDSENEEHSSDNQNYTALLWLNSQA